MVRRCSLPAARVCDRIVVFDGPRELIGRIVLVEIVKTDAFTLFGNHPSK